MNLSPSDHCLVPPGMLRRLPEEMLKKKKKLMVGNLWRESEENRVRLVGKYGKNFPLLSAGGEGHGGISWGVCPAVSLLAHRVPVPSSNWAG